MFRTGCKFLPADSIVTVTRAQAIARILHKKAYLCLNSSTG